VCRGSPGPRPGIFELGDRSTQPLYVGAWSAFGGALVALVVYHFAVVAPGLGRLRRIADAHDELLGGVASRAKDRVAELEQAAQRALQNQQRTDMRLAELERLARAEIPRVGFVRFNAFEDVGSDLSFALALLNEDGDGVVVSSLYSREQTRTYGKAVKGFTTVTDASKEERAAIEAARAVTSGRPRTNGDTFARRSV
jgi:hypothetical protein